METILNRRSIRKYSNKEVEKEKIDKILRAGMQAPSAVNQQPWEFIVVQKKETLTKLSKLSQYSGMVEHSGVSIVVLGNEDRMLAPAYWEQDLGACTQNMLLEVVEQGLGSVWIGTAPIKERMDYIREIFSLEEKIRPFCIISIGYPEEGRDNKFVDRYEEERVHFENY